MNTPNKKKEMLAKMSIRFLFKKNLPVVFNKKNQQNNQENVQHNYSKQRKLH